MTVHWFRLDNISACETVPQTFAGNDKISEDRFHVVLKAQQWELYHVF